MNPFRLDGKISLITGGGTGLGLAMAKCMADAGAKVVIVGRRENELRNAVESIGESAKFIVHDVTNVAAAADLARRAGDIVGGPINILVNNAGIHLKKWAVDTTDAEFAAVLSTHLTGAFALTRAVAPAMIEKKDGSILFITSMAAVFGIPQVAAYSAAKSACAGLVRALATEFSPHGVRVNAIAPGWIDSAMLRGAFAGDPARAQRVLSRTPLQRLGDPTDIGHAAVYLCSPAASFVTGVMLPVDGGVSIGF
jgi:NAD(P)-dependent dehydrogenase (short-subunit alcohol dehydrogenase family)